MYLSEFSYGFEYDAGSSVAGFAILFYLLYFLVMIGIAVAVYVIKALSLSTIASRRGIRHPWLAWLPIGEAWILGCISDQYRYVALGQVKNKRKIMLVLSILMYAAPRSFNAPVDCCPFTISSATLPAMREHISSIICSLVTS